ncbi:MAG: alginate export family protein [Candidatus Omnitrophica bacterium]|nr:alginate export family protein [Candidatus Omnitrophota bacterium]MBU4303672.1 alginate export family protein [Candidatus Omnitrophota bacterium]MBU4419102.1 alginate export family protein [Candidatus Omnitrophota bacterium]MBU4468239.1 alginate export family protein [Candidatus Omnitrophota bacterium]MCG2708695.1 alginate export family protein [Candidatus Omnitrophota bacterium]
MGKRLIAVLALALAVGLTFSAAYAEVQNVKVSGDINVLGVTRSNFDLGYGPVNNNDQNLFATITRVRIDADLTDNVMATVRLINERNWSSETVSSTDIDLDLAYVTLKEFLYSPLTLTVGRQELRFGNALIVGNGNRLVNDSTPVNRLPRDLTSRKAFDAIRATLNYDPLIIDAVYSKVTNVNTNLSDDIDLYGINASYDLSKKLNVQAYVWDKKDKSAGLDDSKPDDVATIGALVSGSPIENLKASFEGALQTGHNRRSDEADVKQHRGFALQGLVDYTFAKTKYTPNLGVGYTYLSGNSKKVTGWDPIFTDQRLNSIVYAILPYTNMTVYNVKGSVKPVEDVTLSANYGYYLLNKSVANITNAYTGTAMAINSNKKNLGSALDLTATYDYTEDVQLGLTAGAFWKGTAFAGSKGDTATQLIGSMKVIF